MFCKFSNEYAGSDFTSIENVFLSDYLVAAPAEYSRIYLYCYYLCTKGAGSTLEETARTLNVSSEKIIEAFKYWQDLGLVQLIDSDPKEVRFMPVRGRTHLRKFKTDKFNNFNKQALGVLNREILPNEWHEYYTLIEAYNLQPEALIMIMKYCTLLKSNSRLGYSYILAVARAWAQEGILTAKAVETRLNEYELNDAKLKSVLKALGSARSAYIEEKQLYQKWTGKMDFGHEVVLHAAKSVQKGGFAKLDAILQKYYEARLFSVKEIDEFENKKQELYALAKEINKTIGVYYENLDNVVESYIIKWQEQGFDKAALKRLAGYCFANSVRTLEGMNDVVSRFYKLGLLSVGAIEQHVAGVIAADEEIKEVLTLAGLLRNVTAWDREAYRTWTITWGMPKEVVLYAAGFAKNKTAAIGYINKILASWFDKGVKTLEEAKLQSDVFKLTGAGIEDKVKITSRKYSREQMEAVFCNLDEIEL